MGSSESIAAVAGRQALATPGSLARARDGQPGWLAVVTIVLAGGFTFAFGLWALFWPTSFADFVRFEPHTHFVHDIGAFQIGLAVMLFLALIWRDTVALVLMAFLVGNTIHAVVHAVDQDLGGRASDPWLLGAPSLLVAVALGLQLRQLGYVVGRLGPGASVDAWAPFVGQKTVSLTSYRRDGTPIATPVSIVVDGARAFVRSFEQAGKTRRIASNPAVTVAPCTTGGTILGPAVEARAVRVNSTESRHAARLLHGKYPLLHAAFVPLMHRVLLRRKTGRTVHFELTVPSET